MQSVVEEEQKPRRFDEGRGATIVKESNNTAPAYLKTNGSRRFSGCTATAGTKGNSVGSPIEVKPPTKKFPDLLTIDGMFFGKWMVFVRS